MEWSKVALECYFKEDSFSFSLHGSRHWAKYTIRSSNSTGIIYIHPFCYFSVYFLFHFISPFQPINSIQTRISSLKLAACQPNLLSLCTKTLFDFLKNLFSYESRLQEIFWMFIVLKLKMNCNSKNRKPKVFRMINLFCLVVMFPWKLTAKTEGALILSFGFNAFRLALISNVKADALQDSCLNLV